MSYAQSADPPDPDPNSSAQLPFDEVPGLADLVLYLDKLLSDDQAVDVHKMLADIFGFADQNPLSSLSGMPDGPKPGGGAMDAARTGRVGRAHAKVLSDRDRLEQRFPGVAKLAGGRR